MIQILVAAAIARANGSTNEEFCEEHGIPTETYYSLENRFGEINLNKIHVQDFRLLWITELWKEYREPFKTIVGDTLITVFIILALIAIGFMLEIIPYSEKGELLDKIHFYGFIFILVIFAVASAIRILILSITSITSLLKKNYDKVVRLWRNGRDKSRDKNDPDD